MMTMDARNMTVRNRLDLRTRVVEPSRKKNSTCLVGPGDRTWSRKKISGYELVKRCVVLQEKVILPDNQVG